jgi:hypothetical protein
VFVLDKPGLMCASKAEAYLTRALFLRTSRPGWEKHSSLLAIFVNSDCKKFYNIGPRSFLGPRWFYFRFTISDGRKSASNEVNTSFPFIYSINIYAFYNYAINVSAFKAMLLKYMLSISMLFISMVKHVFNIHDIITMLISLLLINMLVITMLLISMLLICMV